MDEKEYLKGLGFRSANPNRTPRDKPTVRFKSDKLVIRSFTERKAAEGKSMSTDGKTLRGLWGNQLIAEWKDEDERIHFTPIGSRSQQSVVRAIRRAATPFDLADYKPRKR